VTTRPSAPELMSVGPDEVVVTATTPGDERLTTQVGPREVTTTGPRHVARVDGLEADTEYPLRVEGAAPSRFLPATVRTLARPSGQLLATVATANDTHLGLQMPSVWYQVGLHGGGYDDLCFLNGMVFVAASNPSVNSAGVNVFPAIDKVTLGNGKVNLTPVLMGNAAGTDILANTKTTLNEVDPDSMTVDNNGQLVLVDQAGSELTPVPPPAALCPFYGGRPSHQSSPPCCALSTASTS